MGDLSEILKKYEGEGDHALTSAATGSAGEAGEPGAAVKPGAETKPPDGAGTPAGETEAAGGAGAATSPKPGATVADVGQGAETKPVGGAGKGEEEPTDEDKTNTPAGLSNEAKTAFWRERQRSRKLLEENTRLKDQAGKAAPKPDAAAASGDAAGAAGGKAGTGDVKRSVETDAKVFQLRAQAQRVIDGFRVEGMDTEQAGRIVKLCDDVKVGMDNPEWCLKIIEMGRAGQFGEESDAVVAEAERELPLITARAQQAQSRMASEAEKVKALQAEVAKALDGAFQKYPALKEDKPGKESPEVKFGREWMKKHVVGEDGKPGRRYAELFKPEAIPELVEDMMNAFRAQSVNRLLAENEKLRLQTGNLEAPISGAGSPAAAGADPKPGSTEALGAIVSKYGG